MMTTTTLERPAELQEMEGSVNAQGGSGERPKSPWVSDHVLLTLSVWWVRNTQPQVLDFTNEVATVFDSLQRDLQ